MTTKNTEDAVREQVAEAYTKAITKVRTDGGCCSGASPCGDAGTATSDSRYGSDVEGVPREAVESSFGCGNPVALAGIGEGDVVLDLGSGAGLDLILVSRKVGAAGKAIGVDMTPAMIEAARANLERAGIRNAEIRRGQIENLPVEDASVDWVISNCVINLSPEKEKVFAEIHRVLKPGGRFSIFDMVVESLPERLRQVPAIYASCVGGAVSETEYTNGLRSAGLAEIETPERRRYEPGQVRDIMVSELGLDVPKADLDAIIQAAKVESVRFTGKRPR
jgi:SAM-dependent methyltransferase